MALIGIIRCTGATLYQLHALIIERRIENGTQRRCYSNRVRNAIILPVSEDWLVGYSSLFKLWHRTRDPQIIVSTGSI